jgi:NADH-quinone oxidoreductase subunit H
MSIHTALTPLASPGITAAADWQKTFFEIICGRPPAVWEQVTASVVIIAAVFLPSVLLLAMFSIWWERKVAGHIQSRPGPNRVGPIGLLQSLADGIKLLLKEDLRPTAADPILFRLAPYLSFAPVFAAFLALPFGPNLTFEPKLNAGVFWILAVLSIEVMGVILAGWSSNNKWAVYGAMREACQMVSYEIPLGLSIIVGVMAAGTLNLVELGHLQGGGIHTWVVFKNPFVFCSFLVYFIASLASNKRAPFDLPESESELVAGFHTEYSGMRFAFFFFAEYAAMFVVGSIQTALFLGGWNDPFGLIGRYYSQWIADPAAHRNALVLLNLAGVGIFCTKALGIVFVQMWLRWTLPRPRIDQVLYACVKVLIPAACVLLFGAALWELLVPAWHQPKLIENPLPWFHYNPFSWSDWAKGGATTSLVVQVILALVGVSLVSAVACWVGYAFMTGRKMKQRLTEADPIPELA